MDLNEISKKTLESYLIKSKDRDEGLKKQLSKDASASIEPNATDDDKNNLKRTAKKVWNRRVGFHKAVNRLAENRGTIQAVQDSIMHRLKMSNELAQLLNKYGLDNFMAALEASTEDMDDLEEIGSSDVTAFVKDFKRYLSYNHPVREETEQIDEAMPHRKSIAVFKPAALAFAKDVWQLTDSGKWRAIVQLKKDGEPIKNSFGGYKVTHLGTPDYINSKWNQLKTYYNKVNVDKPLKVDLGEELIGENKEIKKLSKQFDKDGKEWFATVRSFKDDDPKIQKAYEKMNASYEKLQSAIAKLHEDDANFDANAAFKSIVEGTAVPKEILDKYVPSNPGFTDYFELRQYDDYYAIVRKPLDQDGLIPASVKLRREDIEDKWYRIVSESVMGRISTDFEDHRSYEEMSKEYGIPISNLKKMADDYFRSTRGAKKKPTNSLMKQRVNKK